MQIERSKQRFMFTLTVASSKGGVGKSTTAVNLAAAWAELGQRVLLVDLDSNCTATLMLGEQPRRGNSTFDLMTGEVSAAECAFAAQGIDLITGSDENDALDLALAGRMHREYVLAHKLQAADYDVLVIDTPATGGLATTNALVASDYVLGVICAKDAFAPNGVGKLIRHVEAICGGPTEDGPQVIGALLTFVRPNEDVPRSTREAAIGRGFPMLSAEIPERAQLAKSGALGIPELIGKPDSESSFLYRRVRDELTQAINKEQTNGETDDSRNDIRVRVEGRARQLAGNRS